MSLITVATITQQQYLQSETNLEISYGFFPSPFGLCLLAQAADGICALGFTDRQDREMNLSRLQHEWPGAVFREQPARLELIVRDIFAAEDARRDFHLLLKGTPFQIRVWKALLAISWGAEISYSDVAALIDSPTAIRAAASAVARNPVAVLVPCHRVTSKTGQSHKYRWGSQRKQKILTWEASRCQDAISSICQGSGQTGI